MNAHPSKRSALTLFIALAVIIACVVALPTVYKCYMRAIYPVAYSDSVLAAAQEYRVEPSLIYAVIHTESHFQADARSSADAKGLMQLTDSTFLWALDRAGQSGQHTTEDLFDPTVNIRYGVYVLSLFREQFEETVTALAAYNAGQGRVTKWLKDPAYSADGQRLNTIPYKETRDYVQRVLLAQTRYQRLYDIP